MTKAFAFPKWVLMVLHLVSQTPQQKTMDWSFSEDFQSKQDCDARRNYLREQKELCGADHSKCMIVCVPVDEVY